MKAKKNGINSTPYEESGAIIHSWHQDRLRVALVYPNSYYQGMSNLGLQTVYHLLNQRDDCLCERFFLPSDRTGRPQSFGSIESGRRMRDFDVVAFSISFENDYLNLPALFALGQIPFLAAERDEQHPLILLGGVCAFINPEPLAPVADIVAVGEAEPILPSLIEVLRQKGLGKSELLVELAQQPGVYVPALYEPRYSPSGLLSGVRIREGAVGAVRRQYLADLDTSESRTFITTDNTEFGGMFLAEVSRGCSHGCRFCAAGYVYQPLRERSLPHLVKQVEDGLCERQRIGLVAAAVADYSAIGELQQAIRDRGGAISVASLRLDALTGEDVRRLSESGHKTVAIAPEAGSQRLRDLINKGIDEQQILSAVSLLAEGGITNLKLYFLIGLPTETDDDIHDLIALAARVTSIWLEAGRARGRVGTVTLSVNPFIPKPFTPLQWAPMATEKSLKKTIRLLQAGIAKIPNARLNHESVRAAVLQAFLTRGDRRIAPLLSELAGGGNLKQLAKKQGIDVDFYVTRERGKEELFPWEIIDQGIPRAYLWQEYQRAVAGQLTPPCRPGCKRCGLCG